MKSWQKIKFAVVREDSCVESSLISKYGGKKVLLICSGGCTALNLFAEFPFLDISLLDPNIKQIELLKTKLITLCSETNITETLKILNVSDSNSQSLNQNGEFESLFRLLRQFIYEFVVEESEWVKFFEGKQSCDFLDSVFSNKYWNVAFELFFADAFLETMFGPTAIQNAEKNSYSLYFKKQIQKALSKSGYQNNYFLHHIFLGYYRKDSLPLYINNLHKFQSSKPTFEFIYGYLNDVKGIESYDLIALSNIFDWMSDMQVEDVLKRLDKEMKKDSILLWRQLNNSKNYKSMVSSGFTFLEELENNFLESERSSFYSKLCIGKKK